MKDKILSNFDNPYWQPLLASNVIFWGFNWYFFLKRSTTIHIKDMHFDYLRAYKFRSLFFTQTANGPAQNVLFWESGILGWMILQRSVWLIRTLTKNANKESQRIWRTTTPYLLFDYEYNKNKQSGQCWFKKCKLSLAESYLWLEIWSYTQALRLP